MEEEKKKN